MPSQKSYQEEKPGSADPRQHFLDITSHICPLTFVKARLALERIAAGGTLVIRLNSGEPLENLPRSLAELGYRLVSLVPETRDEPDGVHLLTVARD